MAQGKLEVLLVNAKGLEDTDFFSSMDPYAILTCRSQEQRSSVVSGNGEPEWNESFIFTISDSTPELNIKIMDKDTLTPDDFVGEANIPLEGVFSVLEVPPTSYNVVKDGEFKGEIRVGLTFTPQYETSRGYPVEEESFGGWKESMMN